MRVLDCETAETTYRSLECILGIQRSDLDAILESLDVENGCNGKYAGAPEKYVFDGVMEAADGNQGFEQTYWFHLTRTSSISSFEAGVLPLHQRLDQIWVDLERLALTLVSAHTWSAFRREMGSSQYARQ